MEFAFTSDQRELQAAVRAALQQDCPPAVVRAAWDEPSDALWASLAELGVFAITMPESIGGLGLSSVDQVLVLEETGRAAVPGPIIETVAALPALVAAGEQALASEVLSGGAQVTLASPGGYAVDADRCSAVLVIRDGRVGCLDRPQVMPRVSVDGARRLFAVTGEPRWLDADAEALSQRVSVATAAQLLGLGRHVLDSAVAYASAREQFGKPIGSFQAVQHQLADALLKLSFAAPLVYRAAWCLDHPSAETALDVSLAHAAAADAADLACRKALQVHGAIGYTFEYDLHLWMKRVWSLRHGWGSAAHHRERVGDALFGETHG